ncbi:MAG: hypothetical protein Q7U10_10180 [Thermodesulfovibrionia bacterium]|nr:hypothetical protein [Thermodesulfovibrionia bacterium]
MKRLFLVSLATLFITALLHIPAYSQDKGHIMLTNMAEIEKTVVNEKGEKEIVRVPAEKVLPGDKVIYTIKYENVSDKAAENVAIVDPVPEHMFYKDGSASGKGTDITFSVDKGKTYNVPEKLKVIGEDGKERKAEASEYTDIRWVMKNSLQPGEKGKVEFQAELE